jgi:outer membrane protein insertion porin family
MKIKHFIVGLICMFPFDSSVLGASLEIKGISEKILKELKDKSYINLKEVTVGEVDRFIKAAFATGSYETIDVDETSSDVWTLVAVPIRKIARVSVSGVEKVDSDQLLEAFGISIGERFERSALITKAEKVRQFYSERGYFNSNLEVEFEEPTQGELYVNLKIKEGPVCTLREIRFGSANPDLESLLVRSTKKYLGKPLNSEMASEVLATINAALAENRYLATKVSAPDIRFNETRTAADILFGLERPLKYAVLFEGNTTVSSGQLIEALDLNKPNQLGTNPLTEIASRVETHYRKRGYPHVRIDSRERVVATSFTRNVTFLIQEGPRVRLEKLDFQGTLTRKNEDYENYVITHSTPLIEEGFYSRDDLELGFKNLVTELQNQGFLKSRIISTRTEYDKTRRNATVSIQLDEGPITRLKSVEFKGISAAKSEELVTALGLSAGSALHLNDLEAGLDRLRELYFSRGHLDMRVITDRKDIINYSEDASEASVTIEIFEGPAVTVQSITIEGNGFTKSFVIQRELEFEVGDLLTPKKVEDSQYRLQRLGLFGLVEIKTLESGTEEANRNVIVRVIERDPGIFNFGLGVNTEFNLTVRGYTGIAYQNLAGTGRAISTRLELKRITDIAFLDQRITAGYLEPYLFGSRLRGRVNLSRFNSIINRFRTPFIEAREGTELEFNLERDFTKNYRFVWNAYSISFLKDYQLASPNPGVTQVIGYIGPTFEIDFRDNPFLPRKGFYSRWSVEYADPLIGSLPTIQYIRTNAAINYYLPVLSDRLIFAQSLRGGYLSNVAQDGAVPEIKQFFLGGRSSIRGFNVGTIPPREAFIGNDFTTKRLVQVRSDSYFYVAQSELRIPFKGNLEGVLFYDGGAVLISGYNLGDPYRHSAGLGIRYNTPVGAVSAEYGWALDRRENEPVGVLNFSIGTF